jgi:hypothetical protein
MGLPPFAPSVVRQENEDLSVQAGKGGALVSLLLPLQHDNVAVQISYFSECAGACVCVCV